MIRVKVHHLLLLYLNIEFDKVEMSDGELSNFDDVLWMRSRLSYENL